MIQPPFAEWRHEIHFQPIASIKQNRVIGHEALLRTWAGEEALPPSQVFQHAAEVGLTLELDRYARQLAFQTFRERIRTSPGAEGSSLLFVNFEASLLDRGVLGSGLFLNQCRSLGLIPSQVVIEINESRVHSGEALEEFVRRRAKEGFTVALDDLGTGDSHLTRITRLRPRIIKVDRQLVRGVDRDYYKQEAIRSLALLAHRIGALLLAEGVENLAEAVWLGSAGVDLFQGYFFGKPSPQLVSVEARRAVATTAARVKRRHLALQERRRREAEELRLLIEALTSLLEGHSRADFGAIIQGWLLTQPAVECAYIIDRRGRQVGPTYLPASFRLGSSLLFRPASEGDDHSGKDYYYALLGASEPIDTRTQPKVFISDPYVSLASGRLCRTVSKAFFSKNGEIFVACIDRKQSSR